MASKEYKYVKHSDKQRTMILETAKKLFMENEIKDVSMSQIAKENNITRATLYRYFENKDEIVWEIYISFSQKTVGKILENMRKKNLSTYEKIALYLQGMANVFVEMPEFYKFFFHFSKEYLNNQMYPDTAYTRELYNTTGITSGSTVAFMTENFHDGSIREELDSKTTGVSVTYGALGMIQIIYNNKDSIPMKYGISAIQVLVNALNSMLVSLKKEDYHSELAEHIWDGIDE